MQLNWREPRRQVPEDWVEFQALTKSHILKVWLNHCGNWCGVITNLADGVRRRVDIDAVNKAGAILQVETAYFKKQSIGK